LLRRRRVRLPPLAQFVERLRSALAGRAPRRVDRPEARRAAVAVLLTAGDDPAVLFIKRQLRTGDPWSGQMALPGGFAAPGDESPEATACRETEEETGIVLASAGVPLGALDDVSPRTPYLPPLVVTPYVFLVAERVASRPGPEVQAAVWLPIRRLFARDTRRPFRLHLGGQALEFESIVIDEYTIWGLTHRILEQLEALGAG
jgi:8-oxo-dGTP pyrophosphatase MutT (NUDIX family)